MQTSRWNYTLLHGRILYNGVYVGYYHYIGHKYTLYTKHDSLIGEAENTGAALDLLEKHNIQ